MELYCKNCNNPLTKNPLIEAKVEELKYIDRKELLSEGKFIDASIVEYNFGIQIHYLIHTESISLKNHKDKVKLQGCCGPSNFNSLNQVCTICRFAIGV